MLFKPFLCNKLSEKISVPPRNGVFWWYKVALLSADRFCEEGALWLADELEKVCELKDKLYLITAAYLGEEEASGWWWKLFCKQRLIRTISLSIILLLVLNVLHIFLKNLYHKSKWQMAELASRWSSWRAILPVPEPNGWMTASDPWWKPSSFTLTSQPSSVASAAAEYIHPLFWCVSKTKAQPKREWWEPWKKHVWRVQREHKSQKHIWRWFQAASISFLLLKLFTCLWKEPDYLFLKVFWKRLAEKSLPTHIVKWKEICQETNSHGCLSAWMCGLGSEDWIAKAVIRGSTTRGAVGDEGCICGQGLCSTSCQFSDSPSVVECVSRRLQYFSSTCISCSSSNLQFHPVWHSVFSLAEVLTVTVDGINSHLMYIYATDSLLSVIWMLYVDLLCWLLLC